MKKNAIIILIHQLPEQVNLFLEQLLKDTNMDIYIHINKKNDSVRNHILKSERIFIPTNNVEITWGDDGILRAILLMMKTVNESGKEYGFVLVSTGQDLMIRKGLEDHLSNNPGKLFIDGHKDNRRRRAFVMHKWPNRYRQLLDSRIHPLKIMRRLRMDFFTVFPIFEKKTKVDTKDIVFYYNEIWCAIPSEVSKYLVDFATKNPDFMEIYWDGLVPEEAFMLTILMRSPYRDRIHFDDKGKCYNLTYVKGFNNGHSSMNTMEDVAELDNSGMFFSRKFDIRVDKEVVMHYYNKVIQ